MVVNVSKVGTGHQWKKQWAKFGDSIDLERWLDIKREGIMNTKISGSPFRRFSEIMIDLPLIKTQNLSC